MEASSSHEFCTFDGTGSCSEDATSLRTSTARSRGSGKMNKSSSLSLHSIITADLFGLLSNSISVSSCLTSSLPLSTCVSQSLDPSLPELWFMLLMHSSTLACFHAHSIARTGEPVPFSCRTFTLIGSQRNRLFFPPNLPNNRRVKRPYGYGAGRRWFVSDTMSSVKTDVCCDNTGYRKPGFRLSTQNSRVLRPKFTSSPLLAWRAGIMIRRRRGR
mmetsp:Transcript_11348/g.20687  ORF Transcript_11348/g.20687 Transcript_11348/m.20687 type:complete len:216 (+) Transcript_11348:2765-3412(+)